MSDLVQGIVKKTLSTAGSKEMARTFMLAFFKELHECEQSLPELMAQKKLQEIGMMLHKIAGACGYFGASMLHDILLSAEKVARAGNMAELQIQLAKVQASMKLVLDQEQEVLNQLT